jgi:hypothetical protein
MDHDQIDIGERAPFEPRFVGQRPVVDGEIGGHALKL